MNETQSGQFEEWIKARSYAIWESEGHQEGRAAEYWLRAQREVEQEWQAVINCEAASVLSPKSSERPIRRAFMDYQVYADRLAA